MRRGPGGGPGAWLAGPRRTDRAAGEDLDATPVEVHSDNQQAAGHFKRGFGYHPVLALLDNPNEALAGDPAPGNAGANSAADHIRLPAICQQLCPA